MFRTKSTRIFNYVLTFLMVFAAITGIGAVTAKAAAKYDFKLTKAETPADVYGANFASGCTVDDAKSFISGSLGTMTDKSFLLFYNLTDTDVYFIKYEDGVFKNGGSQMPELLLGDHYWNLDSQLYAHYILSVPKQASSTVPTSLKSGWNKNGDSWVIADSNGKAICDQWVQIKGKWYHTDASGTMQIGWQNVKGTWYYMSNSQSDGTMKTGWQKVNGTWYYMNKDGAMQTGWQKIDGKWYLLNASGKMATGWQEVKGKWYFLNADGTMANGWKKSGSKWYFMNKNGAMLTGWQQIDGKWYLLDASGAMKTGWQMVDNKWYFLNSDGTMADGWKKSGSKWYFLNKSGVMQTGWQKISGSWYLLDNSGAMKTGWQEVNEKWYYLKSNGKMATSTWIGNWYVNGSGEWSKTK